MPSAKFPDLLPRVASAAVMLTLGGAALWVGGLWFVALVALAVALMIWELHHMLAPPDRRAQGPAFAALAGLSILLSGFVPIGYVLPMAMAGPFIGFSLLPKHRRLFSGYAMLIILAGFGLLHFRADFGLIWVVWLVLLVIFTDVAGYFAGRLLGGPKIWPQISPKKTWSGTVAGWFGAALAGWLFVAYAGATPQIVGLSIALSMAAQMGDISESALKRKVGVKDASNLIPGHGGLLDRFDGLMGAAVLLLVVEQMAGFPPVGP